MTYYNLNSRCCRGSRHHGCRRDQEDRRKVLTTGVLNTVVDQASAHIELVNLDPVETFQVRVQVIDWGTGTPTVLLNDLVTLLPNHHVNLTQDVSPFHYEVRIFHPGSPNVIANTFAINEGTYTLPGLTFNQKQLMELEIPYV